MEWHVILEVTLKNTPEGSFWVEADQSLDSVRSVTATHTRENGTTNQSGIDLSLNCDWQMISSQ